MGLPHLFGEHLHDLAHVRRIEPASRRDRLWRGDHGHHQIRQGQICLTTFVPMLFMFTTTLTASWDLVALFLGKAAAATAKTDALTFKMDAFLVFLMAALAVISLLDMLFTWRRYFSEAGKMPSSESAV